MVRPHPRKNPAHRQTGTALMRAVPFPSPAGSGEGLGTSADCTNGIKISRQDLCILTKRNVLKPIDKSTRMWYNIVRKRERESPKREEKLPCLTISSAPYILLMASTFRRMRSVKPPKRLLTEPRLGVVLGTRHKPTSWLLTTLNRNCSTTPSIEGVPQRRKIQCLEEDTRNNTP